MEAAVTVGKKNIEIRELPRPVLDNEEALIEVLYTGICGTDLHIYEGSFPLLNYPITPGHEFVGRLVEIKTSHSQLKKFKPGDIVVAQPFYSCYICDTCAGGGDNYCNDIKVHGVHINGSMADFVKVPAKKLLKVQDDTDLKLASLAEPLAVGVQCVTKSELKLGSSVYIIGAGVIGIMIAIAAKTGGASKIVLCDINQYRLTFAESLGFTVFNTNDENIDEKLQEITDGKGFDNVFEATATAYGVKTMTSVIKRGGIILQVGITSENHPINIRSFSDKEIQVRGTRLHSFTAFKAALKIIESGCVNNLLEKIITNVFPLEKAAEAMKFQSEDSEHFKVIVGNLK